MAIAALYFGVAPTQRKSGSRMLEFEFSSKRIPGFERMTLLAWNFEFVPMGAVRRHVRIDWLAHCNSCGGPEAS